MVSLASTTERAVSRSYRRLGVYSSAVIVVVIVAGLLTWAAARLRVRGLLAVVQCTGTR
jgi:hypothetical protein